MLYTGNSASKLGHKPLHDQVNPGYIHLMNVDVSANVVGTSPHF